MLLCSDRSPLLLSSSVCIIFFSLWWYSSSYWVSECIINLGGTGITGAISSVRHRVNCSLRKCLTSPPSIPVLLHQLGIYCVNVFIYCLNHLHLFTIPFISSIDVSKEIYEIVPLYPISFSTFYLDVTLRHVLIFFCRWEMCLPLRITKIVTDSV